MHSVEDKTNDRNSETVIQNFIISISFGAFILLMATSGYFERGNFREIFERPAALQPFRFLPLNEVCPNPNSENYASNGGNCGTIVLLNPQEKNETTNAMVSQYFRGSIEFP